MLRIVKCFIYIVSFGCCFVYAAESAQSPMPKDPFLKLIYSNTDDKLKDILASHMNHPIPGLTAAQAATWGCETSTIRKRFSKLTDAEFDYFARKFNKRGSVLSGAIDLKNAARGKKKVFELKEFEVIDSNIPRSTRRKLYSQDSVNVIAPDSGYGPIAKKTLQVVGVGFFVTFLLGSSYAKYQNSSAVVSTGAIAGGGVGVTLGFIYGADSLFRRYEQRDTPKIEVKEFKKE